MRNYYYLFLITALSFTACKKQDSNSVTPATQSQPLASKGEFHISSFTAKSSNNISGAAVRLNWSAMNENTMHHWTIERATDGNNWHNIAEIPCSLVSGAVSNVYTDKELSVKDGDILQYRVKVFDHNGETLTTKPVQVRFGERTAE